MLTSYDGNTITYDTIGNPLTDGTWTYTWQNGRELASMSNGATTWTYTYDANGMRKTRSDGTTTYTYLYNGSQLMQMWKNDTDVLHFYYDASGTPVAVKHNGTLYYYVTTLQGDVLMLLDSAGNELVAYNYDAWGNLLEIGGTMASTLGALNPLTYRSYTYDHETRLYYLQSRYYNPEIDRFINADSFIYTSQGLLGNNMFAYCNNNPLVYRDSSGNRPELTFGNPIGEFGYMIGRWLYEWLNEETEEDKARIADGTVSYSSNGQGNGARINNSYKIRTPWVMYQYVAANRCDDIAGTTTGAVVEWAFHNIAYDIGTALELESISLPAKDVDVGKTIYSDRRSDFSMQMIMSLGMQLVYTIFSPITAAYDLGTETGRWDHVYPRE